MSNAIFPNLPGLSWSVIKSPEWNTKTQMTMSGRETRASFRVTPIYNISLSYEILRADARAEMQTLFGFYNARMGSFDDFLFDDPTDDQVSNQWFGTGDGSTVSFQLQRTLGGATEPVMNVNMLSTITVNGIATTSYSVNTSGMITFLSAPASGAAIAWAGSYYYRCRFAKDTVDFENFMYQVWSAKKIDLRGCLGTKI